MKRFLVFAGSVYYPRGGWSDFWSDHRHHTDALTAAREILTNPADLNVDETTLWAHVYDSRERKIVDRLTKERNGKIEYTDAETLW